MVGARHNLAVCERECVSVRAPGVCSLTIVGSSIAYLQGAQPTASRYSLRWVERDDAACCETPPLEGMLRLAGLDLEGAVREHARRAGFREEPTLRMLKPRADGAGTCGGSASEPIFVFRKAAGAPGAAALGQAEADVGRGQEGTSREGASGAGLSEFTYVFQKIRKKT